MAEAAKEFMFKWEGRDRSGKRLTGQIQAANENLVKIQLRKQGINPLRVSKQSSLFGPRKKPITNQDIAIFSRQMATMMTAGVPLVQALEIIGKGHDNPTGSRPTRKKPRPSRKRSRRP